MESQGLNKGGGRRRKEEVGGGINNIQFSV